jgi:hypothetical protein
LPFDSAEGKNKFFYDPDYVRDIQLDECRAADVGNTCFFVAEEWGIITVAGR